MIIKFEQILFAFSYLNINVYEPFKTCTVTDVLAISVSEQVYFPESEVCALAIKSLLFAPFVSISVFTLKVEKKSFLLTIFYTQVF